MTIVSHTLVVLLGDGGVGKSTLCVALADACADVHVIKSDTSRPQRADDPARMALDARIYHFRTVEEMLRDTRDDPYIFPPIAQLGHLYGTRISAVEAALAKGTGILSLAPSVMRHVFRLARPVSVVWVEAPKRVDRRDAARRALDDAERAKLGTVHLHLTNAHAPGGLERAVAELRRFVATLP